MTRPKRLYLNSKGKYYYIIDGKKKYIKVPPTMSQKQVQNINIKNIIGSTTARRLKRRKKKVEPRYQQRIVPNMAETTQSGLPSYIFRPSKSFTSLGDLTTKADDTSDKKLIDLFLKGATQVYNSAEKLIKSEPSIGTPPVERTPKKGTPSIAVNRNLANTFGRLSTISEEEEEKTYDDMPLAQSPYIEERRKMGLTKKEQPKRTYRNFLSTTIAKLKIRFGRRPTVDEVKEILREDNREVPTPKIESAIKSNPNDRPDAYTPETTKGSGISEDDGLYNDQIEQIMKKRINNFVPVVAKDQVDSLLGYVKKGDKFFSAVVNTDPSSSGGRHWRSIVIDNRDDFPSAEYFDPLCETMKPEETLLNVMREIAKKMNPEKYFKYKFSEIRRQSFNKSNCGYHVCKYIEDRWNGIPFSEASGYDDYQKRMRGKGAPDNSADGEKELKNYEKMIKKKFSEFL
jgi:hypothetical protein